jgi:hemerythrin-like metal-binding protein
MERKESGGKGKEETLYLTGIPGIDNQHRELAMAGNALCERLEKGTLSEEDIILSIESFLQQLKSHFLTEQNLLVMIGFPRIEEHKEDHEKLYALFFKGLTQVKRESIPDMYNFILSSRDSLFTHMSTFDMDYADYTENLIALRKKYNLTALQARVLAE